MGSAFTTTTTTAQKQQQQQQQQKRLWSVVGEYANANEAVHVNHNNAHSRTHSDTHSRTRSLTHSDAVWEQHWDEQQQLFYYCNRQTGESSWNVPHTIDNNNSDNNSREIGHNFI